MINTNQFLNCVWMAAVLLTLGLVPGLYRGALEGVGTFARGLRLTPWAPPSTKEPEAKDVREPRWMALAGVLVLLAGCMAYLVR